MEDEGTYYRFPGLLNVEPGKMGTRLWGMSARIDGIDIAVRLGPTVLTGLVMASNAASMEERGP
jgi:hypothetical protein